MTDSPQWKMHYPQGLSEPFTELSNGTLFPPRIEVLALPPSYPQTPDDLVAKLELRIADGQPVCVALAFQSQPDGPPVTATLIREIDVGWLIEDAIAQTAVAAQSQREWYGTAAHPGSGVQLLSDKRVDDIRDRALKLKRQRSVNDDLLQEVANVYQADETGAPTIAVAELIGTSKRNATRWVALARKRGLIEPYERKARS